MVDNRLLSVAQVYTRIETFTLIDASPKLNLNDKTVIIVKNRISAAQGRVKGISFP